MAGSGSSSSSSSSEAAAAGCGREKTMCLTNPAVPYLTFFLPFWLGLLLLLLRGGLAAAVLRRGLRTWTREVGGSAYVGKGGGGGGGYP